MSYDTKRFQTAKNGGSIKIPRVPLDSDEVRTIYIWSQASGVSSEFNPT